MDEINQPIQPGATQQTVSGVNQEQQTLTVEPVAQPTSEAAQQTRRPAPGTLEAAPQKGLQEEPSKVENDYSLPLEYALILHPSVDYLKLYIIDKEMLYDENTDEFNYFTVIHNNNDYHCLVLIPSENLKNPDGVFLKSQKYLFEMMLEKFKEKMKLFIVYKETPNSKYKTFLTYQIIYPKKLAIDYIAISELIDIQYDNIAVQVKNLNRMISLDQLVQPLISTEPPLEQTGMSNEKIPAETHETPRLSPADLAANPAIISQLVDILSVQAYNAPANLGAKGYLREKIQQTAWPDNWKNTRVAGLTNDADSDSRDLINYAVKQGRLPKQSGNLTALGSLLLSFLDDLGGDDLDKIQSILKEYNLTDR